MYPQSDPGREPGRRDSDQGRNPHNADSEDTDSFGQERAKGLAKIKPFSFVLLVFSLAGIACGLASFFISAPKYAFPMAFPGGAVAGFFCLLTALFGICGVHRGERVQLHGDMKDCCFRCLFCLWMTLINFAMMASLLGFGISGIWCIIECGKTKPKNMLPHRDAFYPCLNTENKGAHIAAAVANLIVCGILSICTFVGNGFWCCYGRSFGFKDRGEVYGYRDSNDERVRELETELEALRSRQAVGGGESDSKGDRNFGGQRDDKGDRYFGCHSTGYWPSAPPAEVEDPEKGRDQEDSRHHGDQQLPNDPERMRVNDDVPPPSYKEATQTEQ